jgi:exosortase/archaeosortase family protein
LKAYARFGVWLAAAAALTVGTAPDFVRLLNQSLGDTFGNIFPAIPFAALLTLIFALSWKDLRDVLGKEAGLRTRLRTRLVGAALVVILFVLEPVTSLSVASSGVSVVLTFYAAALIFNPLSDRFLFPYAVIYAAGVGAPFALQWAFGEPLAALSSDLSARLVGIMGFPVAWQGTQFQLLSRTGEIIDGVVTPGCSSVISVTTFLGLLALMHLDMKKDVRSTATLAVAGIAVLTLLNSVRIMLLMWVGYLDGASAFWGLHNWVGYGLFLGFYLAALPIYTRMGGPRRRGYDGGSRAPGARM